MNTVLVDMDGILADCCADWCDWLSQDYNLDLTTADVTEWDMAKIPKLADVPADEVYSYLFRPGFFKYLKPLAGAIEGLAELHHMNHDIFIVTSPSGPESMVEKCWWVAKHLPFIDQKKIKFSHHKSMIRGDVLIDDRGSTLLDYRKAWPAARVMGIEYPYNTYMKNTPGISLIPSFADTETAWAKIVDSFREWA